MGRQKGIAPFPALTKPEYDRQWLARVRANSKLSDGGCLIWQGSLAINGYGQTNYRASTTIVHRRLYQLHHGVTLDRWVYVCHRCDVRTCINTDHLWLGTHKQNQEDMQRKGRGNHQKQTHCKSGHEFTLENTNISRRGFRQCRSCSRIRQRLKGGWTREQAETLPVTPNGQQPVKGKFPKRGKRRTSIVAESL